MWSKRSGCKLSGNSKGMKCMMKKWMLLAVVLVLCLGVGTALAAPYVNVCSSVMQDGEYMIQGEWIPTFDDEPADGSYVYYKNGVLTLNNYEDGWIIVDPGVTLLLKGTNVLDTKDVCLSISNPGASGDTVTIRAADSAASLTLKADEDYAVEIDGAKLLIESGTVNVLCEEGTGILCENGSLTVAGGKVQVVSEEEYGMELYGTELTVTGGSLIVDTQEEEAIYASDSSITVKGGQMNITTDEENGIFLEDDSTLLIENGSVDVVSYGDEGIDGDGGSVTLKGGTLNITTEEGLGIKLSGGEGFRMDGGTLNIQTENKTALYVEDSSIVINGGTATVGSHIEGMSAAVIRINGGRVTASVTDTNAMAIAATDELTINVPFDGSLIQFETDDGTVYWTITYDGQNPERLVTLPDLKLPSTGDGTPIALLAGLMISSLLGLLCARRRKAA